MACVEYNIGKIQVNRYKDNNVPSGGFKGSIASTSAEGCLTLDPKSWDNFIDIIRKGGNSGDVYVNY